MIKPIILCVDDEPMILVGLKEQIKRTFQNSFEIETAESGELALEIISTIQEGDKKGELQVIICDQVMPGMKGDELLIRLSTIFPETRAVLLTGQADLIAIANAVNRANLYRYISKPWNPDDLMMTIKEASRSFEQDKRIAMQYKDLQQMNDNLETLNKNLELKVNDRTKELQYAMELLNKEQLKSDELLKNILPEPIVIRLKNGEKSVADSYRHVCVLFADIVNFTKLSESISPNVLVNGLDGIFSNMDKLAKKYELEKIKTIGDSYMLTAGLPNIIEKPELKITLFALELTKLTKNKVMKIADFPVEFRIGIHCGDVVAGIIGEYKFLYDLWGDTVNIAQRMESTSEPGKINVSEEFYSSLKNNQSAFDFYFEPRGEIEIKGKGKLNTYFLHSNNNY